MVDLTLQDMHITNLPTNIRTWDGGGAEPYGNSILCSRLAVCVSRTSVTCTIGCNRPT
jgi:hypothetical protein